MALGSTRTRVSPLLIRPLLGSTHQAPSQNGSRPDSLGSMSDGLLCGMRVKAQMREILLTTLDAVDEKSGGNTTIDVSAGFGRDFG